MIRRSLLSVVAMVVTLPFASAQATKGPLSLDDLAALGALRLPHTEIMALAERRGVATPVTPAIARWLSEKGLTEETVLALPLLVHPPERGLARQDIGESSYSVWLPEAWSLAPGQGVFRVDGISAPPTTSCEIILRTWSIGSDARLGRSPEVRFLEDLLPGNARALLEAGFESLGRSPAPAIGLTGVLERFARERIGEPPSYVTLALYNHGDEVLLLRARLTGPKDDEFITSTQQAIDRALRSVVPATARSWPYDGSRTRILMRTDDGTRLIDRAGAPHQPPTGALPVFDLRGEPLCRFVATQTETWTVFGPKTSTSNQEDPVLLSTGTLTPRSPEAVTIKAAALAARRAQLPPAHRIDAIEDPGSRHELCAIASRHFPVPGRPGQPESVGRLTYLPPNEGPPLDLLIRTRPGADSPTLMAPRFLPSGLEILFIDGDRRLCVVPRNGGLPVALWPDGVIAAEPWLQPNP